MPVSNGTPSHNQVNNQRPQKQPDSLPWISKLKISCLKPRQNDLKDRTEGTHVMALHLTQSHNDVIRY